jgi:ATP-dependent Clp protease ATP-binding subunit ClpA
MFERFTEGARDAVVLAQEEAHLLRHNYIGTEHLLLGVLHQGSGPGSRALDRLRIDLDKIRADVVRLVGEGSPRDESMSDAEALRTIGIDVDEVRRRIEEAFGPGALERRPRRRRRTGRCDATPGPITGRIPFTPRAKKALELSLREAVALGHTSIGTEHLLLGLVREGEGLAAQILAARGASARTIRAAVREEMGLGGDSPGRSA